MTLSGRTVGKIVALLALAGCGRRDTAARTEHPAAQVQESALAASKLPGAGGVAAALRLKDSAEARRALADSITP